MRYCDIPDYYSDPPADYENPYGDEVITYDTLNIIPLDEAYYFMGEFFENKDGILMYLDDFACPPDDIEDKIVPGWQLSFSDDIINILERNHENE